MYGYTKHISVTRAVISSKNEQCGKEELIAEVIVAPGTHEGTKYRFANYGDEKVGYIPADVVFVVRVKPHAYFKRDGDDILYPLAMRWSEVKRGIQVQIPTLNVHDPRIALTLNIFTPVDVPKVYYGRGLPRNGNPKNRGNLVVHFVIERNQQQGSSCNIM